MSANLEFNDDLLAGYSEDQLRDLVADADLDEIDTKGPVLLSKQRAGMFGQTTLNTAALISSAPKLEDK